MKKSKLFTKTFSLFLCFAALLCILPFTASAEETEYAGYYYRYTVTDGEAIITKCNSSIFSGGALIIPEKLSGYPITSIDSYAFNSIYVLKSVTIPNTVTSIGGYAFIDCKNIVSVKIGNSVTEIGVCAFNSCTSLESVIIPKSVTKIDENAFSGCTGITDVYYGGTEADWKNITINRYNSYLTSATIHYNSMLVNTMPTKTTYLSGYSLDTSGLTLNVPNNSGTSKIVTSGFTCTPTVLNDVGIQKITVTYGEKTTFFYVTVEELLPCTIAIKAPSATSISYGDSIVLHADAQYLPAGSYVKWTADNGNFTYTASPDASTCTITPNSSGKTTFTATVFDKDGKVIVSATQEMTSKAGFFDKFIAFFKKLFGLTKVYPQVFGVEVK